MPVYPVSNGIGLGVGGGGLRFREPADVFTGADIDAARTARNTYFSAMGNADALAEFQGDQSLAIILTVTGVVANVFETYLPGQQGMDYDEDEWVERTASIQGNRGFTGAQGAYYVEVFTNAMSGMTPAAPTISVNVETGVITPPADWTVNPTAPSAGEDTFRSIGRVNPATETGDVSPTMSAPVDIRAAVDYTEVDTRANVRITARVEPYSLIGDTTRIPTSRFPDHYLNVFSVADADVSFANEAEVSLDPAGGVQEAIGETYEFRWSGAFTPADTEITVSVNGSTARNVVILDGASRRNMTLRDIVLGNVYAIYRAQAEWHYVGGTREVPGQGGMGTNVIPNPSAVGTALLRKATIGTTTYDVESVVLPDPVTGALRDPTAEDWDNTNARSRSLAFDGTELLLVGRSLVTGHTASADFTLVADGTTVNATFRWRTFHHNDSLVSAPQDNDVYININSGNLRRYLNGAWHDVGVVVVFGPGGYAGEYHTEDEALAHVTADDQYVTYSVNGRHGLYQVDNFVAGDPTHYQYFWKPFTSVVSGTTVRFGSGAPPAALGNNGDAYLDTDIGRWYEKSLDAWSTQYTDSADTAFHIGSGVPAAGLGNDGDTYLDEDAGTFYTKAAGAWTARYTIPDRGVSTHFVNGVPAAALGADGDAALNYAAGTWYEKVSGAWVLRYTDQVGMAGQADGVVTGLSLTSAGTFTITRSVGDDIDADVSDELAEFVNAQRGNRMVISSPTRYVEASDRIDLNTGFDLGIGDQVAWLAPGAIGTAAGNLSMRNIVDGTVDVTFPLRDVRGNDLQAADLEAGHLYITMRLNADFRIVEPLEHASVLHANMVTYDATNVILTLTVRQNLEDGDVVVFTTPTVPTGATAVRLNTTDGTTTTMALPLQDRLGHGLNATDLKSGQDYAVYRNGDTSYRVIGSIADAHVFGSRQQASIVAHVLTVHPAPPPVEIVQGDVVYFQMPDAIPASTANAQITVIGSGLMPPLRNLLNNRDGTPIRLPSLQPRAFYATAFDGTNFRLLDTAVGGAVHPTLYFGTSDDATPTAAEATILGSMGMGTIPMYDGTKHMLIYRLESEGDITSVLFSSDATNTNQIGAFTKFGSTIDIGGDDYLVWVTDELVDNPDAGGETLTVS